MVRSAPANTGPPQPDHRGAMQCGRSLLGAFWTDVLPAAQAVAAWPSKTLLHAGPPLPAAPPPPLMNAAVTAILYEGWASDRAAAADLLGTGAVALLPAQDHGVATPLAHVVSPSMPLAIVGDGKSFGCAPLVEGPAPALRFGSDDPRCLDRLRSLSAGLARSLADTVRRRPVAVAPLVEAGLAAGQECHAITAAPNAALLAAITGSADRLTDAEIDEIASNPGFVLPVLMAAAVWRLRVPGSPLRAIGGNGVTFGVVLSALSRRWRTMKAPPPAGTLFPGKEAMSPLGAIGDSAVVDACGLGGQALAVAPALREEWRGVLAGQAADGSAVLDTANGILDPERIVSSGQEPLINLAILDRDGAVGIIGRGVFPVPPALFDATDLIWEVQP